MFSAPGYFPQIGCQLLKERLNIRREGLSKDFPVLGLGRTPLPGRPALQASDQIFPQVANVQISGHLTLVEAIAVNNPILNRLGQEGSLVPNPSITTWL